MQMEVHKTLYPFYLIMPVLVEPQFAIFCHKCFLHFGYHK